MNDSARAVGRDVALFSASALLFFVPLFVHTWLRGEPLHVLHYPDDNLHYRLIHEYALGRFPLDGPSYTSATPPLFHLSLAGLDFVSDGNRWLLRACSLLIAMLFAIMVFHDVRLRSSRVTAWCFAWVLLASPYMAPRGFVLLTENYSYVWFWLAFRPLFVGWGKAIPLHTTLTSALFLLLAALTRQQWLWLCPWMLLALAATRFGPSQVGWPSAASTFAVLRKGWPYALPILFCLPLFALWGGLVPHSWQAVNQASHLNGRAVLFTFVLLGLYVSILVPSRLLQFLRSHPRAALLSLVLSAALGMAFKLRHESLFTDSGFIWFVSDRFPTLFGANSLLVMLAAVGLLDLRRAIAQREWLYVAYMLLFAVSFVSIKMTFQKYYEVPLLAGIFWQLVGFPFRTIDRVGQLTWIGAGIAYLVFMVGKVDGPVSQLPPDASPLSALVVPRQ